MTAFEGESYYRRLRTTLRILLIAHWGWAATLAASLAVGFRGGADATTAIVAASLMVWFAGMGGVLTVVLRVLPRPEASDPLVLTGDDPFVLYGAGEAEPRRGA